MVSGRTGTGAQTTRGKRWHERFWSRRSVVRGLMWTDPRVRLLFDWRTEQHGVVDDESKFRLSIALVALLPNSRVLRL